MQNNSRLTGSTMCLDEVGRKVKGNHMLFRYATNTMCVFATGLLHRRTQSKLDGNHSGISGSTW